MKPILLIHGYSSEGKDNTVAQIYGTLPAELRRTFGRSSITTLNLSRWISLSDGVSLDDVSFAMDRAIKATCPELLESGFHVVIHSTGALVVRNWIRLYSAKPSPIENLVHLAGANFGSGLAHVGKGQLNRWKSLLFSGTGVGKKVLDELSFGSWKTIDLHRFFLGDGCDMYDDYQVQEFCVIGSQTLPGLRLVPIRYVKEDSADNTVRTSAGNLNFNYVPVTPTPRAFTMRARQLTTLLNKRDRNERLQDASYEFDLTQLATARKAVPYAVAYETAHYGKDIGIVTGKNNRKTIMPLIETALQTPYDEQAYERTNQKFATQMANTFKTVAARKQSIGHSIKEQYEGHAQLIFRLRDQYGAPVKDFDIHMKSHDVEGTTKIETLIEDRKVNTKDMGSITFYLRTQQFNKRTASFVEVLEQAAPLDVEITAHEEESDEIVFVPLSVRLDAAELRAVLQSFRTTIFDVTLARLPSGHVYEVHQG